MLIDPTLRPQPPYLGFIGNGTGAPPKRLDTGIYQISHFSFDVLLSRNGGNLHDEDDWEDGLDDLPGGCPCYGVCDSVAQFTEKFGAALRDDTAGYCVSFTRIVKAEESPVGGWRWHKWGEYVGNGQPTTEYLYDEPNFTEVYVFSVYRKRELP